MNPASGALLSLAYIIGLLSTASLGLLTPANRWTESFIMVTVLAVFGIVAAITLPRLWRTGPKPRLWLAAGLVGSLAVIYFQARMPQPELNDISQFAQSGSGTTPAQFITIQGEVESIPRLTRSGRGQFWLEAKQLSELKSQDKNGAISKGVSGKLYVTVPLLQATSLYPGQIIAITGILYEPKPAKNPGAFDFQAYLAREGAFAGMSGRQVSFPDESQEKPWGWWMVRERIIRSQMRSLGSPKGQLVSSMVLGRRAVDLPYDIRDQFIEAGLAHVLAASGFHISLILGLVLALTRRWGTRTQFGIGLSTLIVYVGLTGLQPSVMRAAIMGLGALVALVTQRQVKPLGSLLVAATILLLWNPLWIWDLGFQLSFLATLGLLVTAPMLTKKLDWLPSTIASLIAVSLAASLWTLPLQLYVFYKIAPYSVAANITCSPLIALISLGGVISTAAALVSSSVGSSLAWLLYYPTQLLMNLVEFFNNLPGSSIAVGQISLWQLLLLYGLLGFTSINRKWRNHWWLLSGIALTLVILPGWQTKVAQLQVTILAGNQEQILVVQDRNRVALLNSGEAETATFVVLPFLRQQGVNHLDWAIALDMQPRLRSGWVPILESLSVKKFYDTAASQPPSSDTQDRESTAYHDYIVSTVKSQKGNYQSLSTGETISVASTTLKLINIEPSVLQLQLRNQNWLLLGKSEPALQQKLVASENLPQMQVLYWSGDSLTPEFLDALKPKVAIASSETVNQETAQLLQKAGITLYWAGRDGAIQWTPQDDFQTTLERINKDSPLL
ncbi:ComEC/Rec2 family competence protein [Lyngbya aestuarii]|uniref:ComEC/Rec2 family competence protein n=1 Tax=Lyngbya aestuarii TaxID=118322 RepID=UPI00403D6D26